MLFINHFNNNVINIFKQFVLQYLKKQQKNRTGLFKTEILIFCLITIILSVSCVKIINCSFIFLRKITNKQLKQYCELRILAALQEDLSLPCSIDSLANAQGFIISSKQSKIIWHLKPVVSRGINNNWTPFYCNDFKGCEYQIIENILHLSFLA